MISLKINTIIKREFGIRNQQKPLNRHSEQFSGGCAMGKLRESLLLMRRFFRLPTHKSALKPQNDVFVSDRRADGFSLKMRSRYPELTFYYCIYL